MAAKKKGAKPLAPAKQVGPVLDESALAARHEELRSMAEVKAAFSDEQRQVTLLIGKRLGRRQIFDGLTKLLTVSAIQDLAKIKESKEYKGFQIPNPDGKVTTVSTWAEYCEHVEGRSHQVIDEEIRHLERLGPECFTALRSAGLGPRRLRDIRELPADESKLLVEAADKGDLDAVLEAAEEIIATQKAAKAKLQDERDKAVNQYQARETVIANNKKKIADLEEKIARIPKEKPDEKGKAMILEIAATSIGAQAEVKQLTKGIQMLLEHAQESGISDAEYRKAIVHHASGLIAEFVDLVSLFELSDMIEIPDRLRAALGAD